jgi:hypothetical protein
MVALARWCIDDFLILIARVWQFCDGSAVDECGGRDCDEVVMFVTSSMVDCDSDSDHGQIDYIETKVKCRHLKTLSCKGTLRQVFIRVYRLEIQSVMFVFSTQLCELLPLYPSLCFNSSLFPV